MEKLFLTVLNMSAAASVVIAVVLLARLLLRKAPKKWSYLLWSVVAFRLCCPVSFKSVFSVFRLKPLQGTAASAVTETAQQASTITYIPRFTAPVVTPVTPVTTPVTPVNPVTPAAPVTPVTPAAAEIAQSGASIMTVLTWLAIWLWVAVMAVMIGYSVYSYVKMRRLVTDAVRVRDNIYETDRIRTPFILGMCKPRIYIPLHLCGERLDYVLAHEGYHLRRRDHIVKTLGYLLLTVHWFNPLVWLAFHLMGKDMEMSCDEKVLGQRDGANKAYSSTLLSFAATVGRFPAATPLCFGESSVKSRIRNALSWRKPKLWVTALAMALCAAALVACATNPSAPKNEPISQTEKEETGETEEPDSRAEALNMRMDVTDLGDGVFRLKGDLEQELTVKLPASWAGRYDYAAGPYYPGGFEVYSKEARQDAPEGSTWGRLFAIRCIPGMYPLNYHWGYYARVLATNDAYTVLMEYPDDIQSPEMVHSSKEITERYLAMRREADQVEVTLSEGFAQRTWNEANWVDGAVTIYQNYVGSDNSSPFRIPVVCDAETSAVLRQIFDEREYADDGVPLWRYHGASVYTVVTDEATYDLPFRDEGLVVKDYGNYMAKEPLTDAEMDTFLSAIANQGHTWQVKVTDLGDDTFRLEDAGYTRGLDVTVKLPASWAGRYVYNTSAGGIFFCCKATYDQSYDGGYGGRLCGIAVERRMMSLDEPLPDSSRVLASAGNYSVVLEYPSDVQFTETTMNEYQAMDADRDKVEITLSDWMLANTWNETNWAPGTVSLRTMDANGDRTVICDAEASAAIRQLLESKTYEEHEDWRRDLAGSGMEIFAGDTTYALHMPQGSDPRECYILRNDGRFATEPLSMDELTWLRSVMDTPQPSEDAEALEAAWAHYDELAATKELNGHKVSFLKYVVEEDTGKTERARAEGVLGNSEIAITLTTIFVPESEDDLIYFQAGNIAEYTGDDPNVPEGAWRQHHEGYVAQTEDGWHVEIMGTGW